VASQDIAIRRLTALDGPALAEINREFGFGWDPAHAARFLRDPDNLLLVATVGERICGVLYGYRLQRLDQREAEVLLYAIDVGEGDRRRGVGRRLVEATKRWAAEIGADEVWVITDRANTAAVALYRSAGGVEEAPEAVTFVFPIG
jgi:ribosomal protein S18 acetylase RimI-like enzyme